MTQKIKIINRKKFTTAILIEKNKTFVVNIAIISVKVVSNIHLSQQAQIVLLNVKEITMPFKCTNYINIFSLDSAAVLYE